MGALVHPCQLTQSWEEVVVREGLLRGTASAQAGAINRHGHHNVHWTRAWQCTLELSTLKSPVRATWLELIIKKERKIRGHQGASVGKGARSQAWRPEFNLWALHGLRTELIHKRFLLNFI